MTRKTRLTAWIATLVVAAAAGSSAWGLVARSPDPAAPSPAGACYVEDPSCNDTPGFLPTPAEPVAGLVDPDGKPPSGTDPLA